MEIHTRLDKHRTPHSAIDERQSQSSAVGYVDDVLGEAIRRHASDVHFEPYARNYRVRLRIDGVLMDTQQPPKALAQSLTARLKILSDLDISERRIPQDGRFTFNPPNQQPVHCRVSTCPTLHGEKIVVRLLKSAHDVLDPNRLGMSDAQTQAFLAAIHQSQGLILVTGPTGSGKTVTLYTAMKTLNQSGVNLSSVEDPIEIQLPGINQVPINTKAGMNFATALRAFLRQDPDIIMVGEIRDLETAQIAIRASQTGHLVLSTLHTNSAADTLVRLANMGIPPYNLASSISLVVAQRLARKLCDQCKTPATLTHQTWLNAGGCASQFDACTTVYEPVGCEQCHQGYQGRVGLFEVMPINNTLKRTMLNHPNAMAIAEQARADGCVSLRQSGLDLVLSGTTSLAEINRLIKE